MIFRNTCEISVEILGTYLNHATSPHCDHAEATDFMHFLSGAQYVEETKVFKSLLDLEMLRNFHTLQSTMSDTI